LAELDAMRLKHKLNGLEKIKGLIIETTDWA